MEFSHYLSLCFLFVSEADTKPKLKVTVRRNPEGCLTPEQLAYKIAETSSSFVKTSAYTVALDKLNNEGHVTLTGAPGEGKTSMALMLGAEYQVKKFRVLYVSQLDKLDVNVCSEQSNTLLIIDDLFENVYLHLIQQKNAVLLEELFQITKEQSERKFSKAEKKGSLMIVFTSRGDDLYEGLTKFFKFKLNLFRPDVIVNLTDLSLNAEEKRQIMMSLTDIKENQQLLDFNIKMIANTKHAFGFPMTCRLFRSDPIFQENAIEFFKDPLFYIRGSVDRIVREDSNRSAAFILFALCGTVDMVAFQKRKSASQIEDMFTEIKGLLPSCTRAGIWKEIEAHQKTYFKIENHIVTFSHKTIYDAAACALAKMDPDFLLRNCSLQFMYERVRLCTKADNTTVDDISGRIHVTAQFRSLLLDRFKNWISKGYYKLTFSHPILEDGDFSIQLFSVLHDIIHELLNMNDADSRETILYWSSFPSNTGLQEKILQHIDHTQEKNDDEIPEPILTMVYSAVCACTMNGNVISLNRLIKWLRKRHVLDINYRKSGRTLIMNAAMDGNLAVFEYLVREGANVSLAGTKGKSLLHYACESGQEDMLAKVLETGGDVQTEDDDGTTALLHCAQYGHGSLFKYLVERGANLHSPDKRNRSTLYLATLSGDTGLVSYVLSLSTTDLETRSHGGWTPVMAAVRMGHMQIFNILMSAGANLLLDNDDHDTVLMLAIQGGNKYIVEKLLSVKGVNINQKGKHGWNAIMTAARYGMKEVFTSVFSREPQLEITDDYNNNCLTLAAEGGNAAIIEMLYSTSLLSCNTKGKCGRTPVMTASLNGHKEAFELMLQKGADVTLVDDEDNDCLALASIGGNAFIVRQLLSTGLFDINRRGQNGQTAIMKSVMKGQKEAFEVLLSGNVDLQVTDDDDNDCLTLAASAGHVHFSEKDYLALFFSPEKENLLTRQLMAMSSFDMDLKERHGKSMLNVATEFGQRQLFNLLESEAGCRYKTNEEFPSKFVNHEEYMVITQKLLETRKLNINRRGKHGWSPIMAAAIQGQTDIFVMLSLAGADVRLTDVFDNNLFMLACLGGSSTIVQILLETKLFDINRRDSQGFTPLLASAFNGRTKVFEVLISEGADLFATDDMDNDCLMMAAVGGSASIVKFLLKSGKVDINRRGTLGWTPVMASAREPKHETFEMLFSEGANVTLVSDDNINCLIAAVVGEDQSIVKAILPLGIFDVNSIGPYGETAIMHAIKMGNKTLFDILLAHGADITMMDNLNNTCLLMAAGGGNLSILKTLLSAHYFNINQRGNVGWSPVMVAARHGNKTIFEYLVSLGSDLTLIDEDGDDILFIAATGGSSPIVKYLVENGHDINRKGTNNWIPIMQAAREGNILAFETLLTAGSDLLQIDVYGDECLRLAVLGGNVSIVTQLLSMKLFNINKQGFYGWTPIMTAIVLSWKDIFNLLLHCGSDVSITNDYEHDCFELAISVNCVPIVNQLIALNTFSIDRTGLCKQTPIMISAKCGNLEMFKLLLAENPTLTFYDEVGNNLLILASYGGNPLIVEHLLELDIFDIDERGQHGTTALMVAASQGRSKVLELLLSKGADLKLSDHFGDDCLFLASAGGNESIVKFLLSSNLFDINRPGHLGKTPILAAARNGNRKCFDILMAAGAYMTVTEKYTDDCLILASAGGSVSILKKLLRLPTTDINRRGRHGQTAIMVAAKHGEKHAFDILLAEGANVLLSDDHNDDCFILAAFGGNFHIVQKLLSMKTFNIDKRGKDEKTAIMNAAIGSNHGQNHAFGARQGKNYGFNTVQLQQPATYLLHVYNDNNLVTKMRKCDEKNEILGHDEIFQLLLSVGSNIKLTDRYGNDCLNLAASGGNIAVVRQIVSMDILDINKKDQHGRTPIMNSIMKGEYEVFKFLLYKGAHITLSDKYNNNCLWLASVGGSGKILKRLLDLGLFDIECPGQHGFTPILAAIQMGRRITFDILLSQGADTSVCDDTGENCLMLAAASGDHTVTEILLSIDKFDINKRGVDGRSPMMIAVLGGHEAVFHLLISKGADIIMNDDRKNNILILAAKGGNASIVKHLLEKKVFDINQEGQLGLTAVMAAILKGHYGVFTLLAAEGAELMYLDERHNDCLMLCAQGGNVQVAEKLLSTGLFNINKRGENDWTPIMGASFTGNVKMLDFLLSTGADLTLKGNAGYDCFSLSCQSGRPSIARRAIETNAFDINQRIELGRTGCMVAALHGHTETVNVLISYGADLTLTDDYGHDCLILASATGGTSVVHSLLRNKVYNNKPGQSKGTAVVFAAHGRHKEVMETLILAGADIDSATKGGTTAILAAAEHGHQDIFDMLFLAGADLNCTDDDNDNCFVMAAAGGKVPMLSTLLSTGKFDINIRGGGGQTALMNAVKFNRIEVFNHLVERGADMTLTDDKKNDCLSLAVSKGHQQLVKLILNLKDTDVNRRCDNGKTALMVAADEGHTELFEVLLSVGADVSIQDDNGKLCNHYALKGGNAGIIETVVSLMSSLHLNN